MRIFKLFLLTMLFILLAGFCGQLGAVSAAFAFGTCAFLCFSAILAVYLDPDIG